MNIIDYLLEEHTHLYHLDTPYNGAVYVACIENHPFGFINGYIGVSTGWRGAIKRSEKLGFQISEESEDVVTFISSGEKFKVTFRYAVTSDVRDWISKEFNKQKEIK